MQYASLHIEIQNCCISNYEWLEIQTCYISGDIDAMYGYASDNSYL